ncbi:hypothetical protein ACWDZ4_00810 [Streptomyces sp. NPDC003016]
MGIPLSPIAPAGAGRGCEALIRVNSQSGKGGIAHLLQEHHGLDLPQGLRPGFSRVVRTATDDSGREATPGDLWEPFRTECLAPGHEGPPALSSWATPEPAPGQREFTCELRRDGGPGRHRTGFRQPGLPGRGPGHLRADRVRVRRTRRREPHSDG